MRRFDPDRNIRFSSYAGWWIRAAIQDHVLNLWSVVKIGTTAAQKKLFFNLNRLKKELDALDDKNLTPGQVKEISARLKVSDRKIQSMSGRVSGRDYFLNVVASEEQDTEWIDLIVDDAEDQEVRLGDQQEVDHERQLIHEAMKFLDQREKHIFQARRLGGEKVTLDTLSREYGVSRERIRQIEMSAFKQVKGAVLSRMQNSIQGGASPAIAI